MFVKQLMFCALGLVLFWVGLRIPPQRLRILAAPMLLLGIVLLVAVLIRGIGALRGGSRAWFASGRSRCSRPRRQDRTDAVGRARAGPAPQRAAPWRHALLPVVPVSLLIFVLLMLQPDLGTTVSMGIVLIALLFFGGRPDVAAGRGLPSAGSRVRSFSG